MGNKSTRWTDGIKIILNEDFQWNQTSTVYKKGLTLVNVSYTRAIDTENLLYTGDAVINDTLHILSFPREKCTLLQSN